MSVLRRYVRAALWHIGYGWGPRLMSELRKRWILLSHPHANIVFEGPVHIAPGFSLYIPGPGSFIVGPGVEFRRGFRAEIGRNGRVVIGAGSYFTYDAIISCDTSIEIGERCGIGQNVYMVDGNHRYRDLDRPMLQQGYDYRPLRIADDASIFSKCTIIASVGTRAVVAANSVVTRDVPDYCVAAGVPARVIDYFGPDERSASSAATSG
jgi:acetyltransferase-like isoleucine patch superfamily enzyme